LFLQLTGSSATIIIGYYKPKNNPYPLVKEFCTTKLILHRVDIVSKSVHIP